MLPANVCSSLAENYFNLSLSSQSLPQSSCAAFANSKLCSADHVLVPDHLRARVGGRMEEEILLDVHALGVHSMGCGDLLGAFTHTIDGWSEYMRVQI